MSGTSPPSNARRKKAKAPVYYEFSEDYAQGGAPGWEPVNYATVQRNQSGFALMFGWPDGYLNLPRGPWTLGEFVEKPRFLIDRKLGRPPRDVECIDDFFFISPKMKSVFEAADPLACEFRPCESYLPSGEPGPEIWLCSITRAFVGAVDIDGSEVRLMPTADGLPSISRMGARLKLKDDVISGAHLFRVAEMGGVVLCDQAFKDACKQAGIKGARFEPISIG